MSNDELLLKSFSIGGYRSFGKVQRFEHLSKVNLFIGQNNCGKSNVIKFISEVLAVFDDKSVGKLTQLDRHIGTDTQFCTGLSISLDKDSNGNYLDFGEKILSLFAEDKRRSDDPGKVIRVLEQKIKMDKTGHAWFDFTSKESLIQDRWEEAFAVLDDKEIYQLWRVLCHMSSGGARKSSWFPGSLKAITPKFTPFNTAVIPAVRKIGDKGSVSDAFSGDGIIERLVRLQNPDVHNQGDRDKFSLINEFLEYVTGNESARIEIPHERDTILVHMDGKTLPLESLGTGIHEVIILAAASTILEDTVICMEEPELHLNPILQKKLVRYLLGKTKNQYFITTHSASLMNTPSAEIYQINLIDGVSSARRVTSDKARSEVCLDLGYHPSDLLQANCVIWVEGPSDRNYLNFWLSEVAPAYVEGIHYSIMFYGGRLAAHLTGDDNDGLLNDFISLRRLNRRGVIVIDSDRSKKGERLNRTKLRLQSEFDEGPGFAWITEGREIENYINSDTLKSAIKAVVPSANNNSTFGRYSNTLKIVTRGRKKSYASKVKVSKYITESFGSDLNILNLKNMLNRLTRFIEDSNDGVILD